MPRLKVGRGRKKGFFLQQRLVAVRNEYKVSGKWFPNCAILTVNKHFFLPSNFFIRFSFILYCTGNPAVTQVSQWVVKLPYACLLLQLQEMCETTKISPPPLCIWEVYCVLYTVYIYIYKGQQSIQSRTKKLLNMSIQPYLYRAQYLLSQANLYITEVQT